MAESKIMRLVVRELKREYPGRQVWAEQRKGGHVHYFVDGTLLTFGPNTPKSMEPSVRATMKYAREQAPAKLGLS